MEEEKEWWILTEEEEAELKEKLSKIGRSHKKKRKNHEEVLQEIADGYKALFSGFDQAIRIENETSDMEVIRLAAFEEGSNVEMDISFKLIDPPKRNHSYASLPFRTDNVDEVARNHEFDGEPFLFDPKGFEVVAVIPPKRKNQYRQTLATVKKIGLQMRYLNPEIKESVIDDYMVHLLTQYSTFMPGKVWIDHKNRILKEVMETPPNKIEPKVSKVKTLWNPDYDFTEAEKRSILQEYRQKAKRNKTLQMFIDLYLELNSPTQKQIANESGKSLRTVKRYWTEIEASKLEMAA